MTDATATPAPPADRPADAPADAPDPAAIRLADVTLEALGELHKPALVDLAAAEGLARSGTKAQLLARLRDAKCGGAAGYVPGKTLCRFCGAATRVRGTQRISMADGRVMVSRSLRCAGAKPHSYAHKTIVGTAAQR